ncbi:MAG TPA: ABC transporter permease [Candidatus Acidoferrales bacterium]|nr:ABC transporter permease [Candidatus Acidoferrales bacterium]
MQPEKWIYTVPLRLRSLFRRPAVEQELDEEMRDHIESQTRKNISKGMAPAEARRTAMVELHDLERSKEECRDTRRVNFIENFMQDVRFGLRMLRKSPGFTATAVLTLALGIGANSMIFSMVDWLILRPLPVQSPEQVTYLGFSQGGARTDTLFSYPEFRDIRSQTGNLFSDEAGFVFGGLTGDQTGPDGLTVDGKTQPIQTAFVTGNFFDFLGIKPFMGRFILPGEGNTAGADPVVVLSYKYWQSRFGGDPSVTGKPASIDGHAVTIVGVAPKGFPGPTPIVEMQAYLPLGMVSVESPVAADLFTNPKARRLLIFGRLKSGVRVESTQTELRIEGGRILEQYPRDGKPGTLTATPLRPPGIVNGGPSNPLNKLAGLFLTLGALLLALACINVASLLLVRAAVRNREMTVRAALGASRGRLLRQMLTESVLLSLLGCVGGLIVGLAGNRAITSMPVLAQNVLPLNFDFQFDWRVFAYAFAVALLTGILAGLVPALRVSRSNLGKVLHDGGRTLTAGRSYFRAALVAAEVGGSLTLLIVAGLFVRSLQGLKKSDLGFDSRNVLNLTIDPNEIGYTKVQGQRFFKQLLERVRGIPGIESASLASVVPLDDSAVDESISIPGYSTPKGEPAPSATINRVSPGYFKTMKVPMLRGRDLADADDEGSLHVAIINEAMTKRFWPNQDALGRQFAMLNNPKNPITIVGIMKDSRIMSDLYGPIPPSFVVPTSQNYSATLKLQIRTSASPETMARPVQQLIEILAPTMPVFNVETMTDVMEGLNGLFIFRAGAWLTALLGILGLILAIVGVYGVMSYSVSQRTNEIGIRMALGAQPWQILKMIWRRGMVIIGAGIVSGLFAAFALSQLANDFVVGVSPIDAVTYVGVSALLTVVALLACYIPARRAMRVDPLVALRYE